MATTLGNDLEPELTEDLRHVASGDLVRPGQDCLHFKFNDDGGRSDEPNLGKIFASSSRPQHALTARTKRSSLIAASFTPGSGNELLGLTLPQLQPFFRNRWSGVSISGTFPWLADFPRFSLVFARQNSTGSDTEMSESLFEIACSEVGWSRRAPWITTSSMFTCSVPAR